MELDYEYAFQIMREIEEFPKAELHPTTFRSKLDEDVERYKYHIRLLAEGGYLTLYPYRPTIRGTDPAFPKSLTWDGHQWLNDMRDDDARKGVLNKMKEEGKTLPFDVVSKLVREVGLRAAREFLGLP